MRSIKFIFSAALLSTAAAAHADWQYTKWGMTPAQVAAASKGQAHVGKGDPKEEYEGSEIGAMGTYTSGDYRFTVNFHFAQGKLVDVHLKMVDGDQYRLKNDLLGVYGKPFDESTRLNLTTWHDVTKNNRIDLLLIGAGYTSLEYRPLKNDSAAGL